LESDLEVVLSVEWVSDFVNNHWFQFSNIQNQRTSTSSGFLKHVSSGYFKNLEELLVFMKELVNEVTVLYTHLCDFFVFV